MASFPGQKSTGSPLPNPPLNLAVTGTTTTTVSLTWTAPNGGSTSYNLYRNGSQVQTGITGTTATDTGLTAGTQYTYYVTSQKAIGEGSRSNQILATTGTVPNAPTALNVTGVTSSTIALGWTAPVGGASSYNLYRNSSKVQTGIATTSTTDTGLTASTLYTYNVSGSNGFGEGPLSSPVNGTTSSVGGQINWNPGFRFRANGAAADGSNSANAAVCAYVAQNDVTKLLKGAYFVATLNQLEGSTPGDFTAGDVRVTNWCNLVKPHGWDLSIAINVTGNVNTGGVPAYMLGNSTYGPVTTTSGGTGSYGGAYLNAGATLLTRVQNANVAARIAVILAHYQTLIASLGVTLYAVWVTYSETSFNAAQQSAGWDATTFSNGVMGPGGLCNQLRSALPHPKIMVSPTFLTSPDDVSDDPIWHTWQAGLKNYFCTNGNYDSTNETGGAAHRAYPGDTQFRGQTTGGVTYPTCQNLVGIGDSFCHQSEDSLCGNSSNPSLAVPPARIGDGTLPIVSQHWPQQGTSDVWFGGNGFEGQLCNNFQQSATWGPAPNYSTCDWAPPGTQVNNGGICGYIVKHWSGGTPFQTKPGTWP